MGFFSNTKDEAEKIRGVSDDALGLLSNDKLLMLAMARLYEAEGIEDEALIGELYKRARAF